MAMKKIFLSFADSRYYGSRQRIKKQARYMGVYDKIMCMKETDLDSLFVNEFKEKLILGSRGFGYWVWKPQIILQILNECDFGDIIQYSDVGCHLNPEGKNRLLEYFDYANQSINGILSFSYTPPHLPLHYDGRELFDWKNRYWTKGDLLDYFNMRENISFLNNQTTCSGVFFIKKTPASIKLLKEWLETIRYNFSLVDDTPSISPNELGFIEHRHDQAIFAILCYLYNVPSLSAYEQYYPSIDSFEPDWKTLEKFPIHVRRDKNFGFYKRLRSRLYRLF